MGMYHIQPLVVLNGMQCNGKKLLHYIQHLWWINEVYTMLGHLEYKLNVYIKLHY